MQTEQWNELAIASGVPLNAIAREYAMSLNKGTPEGAEIAAMSEGEWSNWMRKRMEKGLLFPQFESMLAFAAGKYPNAMLQASQTQVGKESTLGSNVFLALAEVGKAFQPVSKGALDALNDLVKGIHGSGAKIANTLWLLGQAWDTVANSPIGEILRTAGVFAKGVGIAGGVLFNLGTDKIGEGYESAFSQVTPNDIAGPNLPAGGGAQRVMIEGGIRVDSEGNVTGGSVKAKSGSDEQELLKGR